MAPEQLHTTITATAAPTEVDPLLVAAFPQWFGPGAVDPDAGTGHVECTDIIATLSAKFTGVGGVFSTYGERHAFEVGIIIGYTFVNKTVFIPCPTFFQEDAHYFYIGLMMGRAYKKLEDNNINFGDALKWWKEVAAGLATSGGAFGTLFGPTIVKYIQTLMGAG